MAGSVYGHWVVLAAAWPRIHWQRARGRLSSLWWENKDLVARRAAYSRRRRPAGKVQENQRAIDVCKGPDPGNALWSPKRYQWPTPILLTVWSNDGGTCYRTPCQWLNAVLMLRQRRRRWPNIETTLGQCLVLWRWLYKYRSTSLLAMALQWKLDESPDKGLGVCGVLYTRQFKRPSHRITSHTSTL